RSIPCRTRHCRPRIAYADASRRLGRMMKKYLAWKQAELDNPSVACASDAPSVLSAGVAGSSSLLLPSSTTTSLVSATSFFQPASQVTTVQSEVAAATHSYQNSPAETQVLRTIPQVNASQFTPITSVLPTGSLAAASHLVNLHQLSSSFVNQLPSSTLLALLTNQSLLTSIQTSNPTLASLLQRAAASGTLADGSSPGGGVLPPPAGPSTATSSDVAATLAAIGAAGGNGTTTSSSNVPPEAASLLGAASSPSSAFLTSGGGSAFSLVPHPPLTVNALINNSSVLQQAAQLYPQLMCLGPEVLEKFARFLPATQMAQAAGFKPLPNMEAVKPLPTADTRTDLSRYKLREPRDWTAQDVVSWMLDTSRRMQIPFEDVNMTKFAGLPGLTLMNSSEADWIANDPVYGLTFFREFQALITGSAGDRALEEYMRKLREEELQHPSTSNNHFLSPAQPSTLQQQMNTATLEALDQVKMRMGANSLASTLSAALSPSMGLNSLHASLSPQSPLLIQSLQNKQLSPLTSTEMLMNKYSLGQHLGPGSVLGHNSHGHDYDSDSDDSALHGVNDKIRKNKDGKPRKRSQHSKGNKLWEFIRDALKDPSTCPSIVRWEDPHEGVFRIVESERLARLWGERKNNQKMTYEKLSRAMRTYYEKQILVPVPKTGLYPKKLVYKFGPGATGWENCRALAGIPPKL
ncbi:hypothetical protein PMAYCL1PPCAC_31886, partial [Pristionchus mayeri]